MDRNKESKSARALKYEACFAYSEGALSITPGAWHIFAWNHFTKRTANCVGRLVKKGERILIVGIGRGDILPYVWLEQDIPKIGIDVNKKFLLDSKEYCDVIMASASHLPIRECTIHLIFFDLVLHHLKGQRNLEVSLNEANRVLVNWGQLIAIEPNSLNPSGFLMNMINIFHLYSLLFGGSNFEYAISPKEIKTLLSDFSSLEIRVLTFVHPRLPISIQRYILKKEKILSKKFGYFAWMLMITARKAKKGET